MKKLSALSVLLTLLLLPGFWSQSHHFLPLNASALAQGSSQDGTRGVKVQVGATRDEVKAGKLPKLWAVIIGISRYANGDEYVTGNQIRNLKYAADDAQAMYNFLLSEEGGSFPPENVLLLRDEEATKAKVEDALNKLRQTRPEDYFVLYIATHGILVPQFDKQINATREVPYFVLHDTMPDVREVERTALKMEAFSKAVREVPARKGLVLTDTCHSAGVLMAGRGVEVTTRANNKLIEEIGRIPQGVGWITAAQQTEMSYEPDELKHGVFTWSVLEALRGNGDANKDGMVNFAELVSYLREEVPRRTDRRQNPHFNTDTVEANYLPLSRVLYTQPAENAAYGTLVIRNPDCNGVMVAVNGAEIGLLNSGAERTVRLKAGAHTLAFTKDARKVERPANIEAGKSQLFELNLSFSESDDDDLVEPSKEQTNVYLKEAREPSQNARDLFLKGVDSFNKQRFEEAVDLFTQAVQQSGGTYPDALVYRGRAEQSLGRKRAAVTSFETALQLRPSDYQTQTLLAEAKLNAGDNLREVETMLQSITRRYPNYDFARIVYADLLYLRGDLIRARLQLQKAILLKPKSPPAHLILADVLMDLGAREMIQALNDGRPTNEASARLQEAIREAETALQLFEELGRKQVSVARGLRRLSISHVIFGGGRYLNSAVMAEANHTIAKALVNAVERDETLTNAQTLLDRARPYLQQALNLSKTDNLRQALVLSTSALHYFLKGQSKTAIKEGEAALKLAEGIPDLKDFPDVRLTLANAYASEQDFIKAADQMERFLRAAPKLSPQERQQYQEQIQQLRRDAENNRKKR